jgi:hypothetical protein
MTFGGPPLANCGALSAGDWYRGARAGDELRSVGALSNGDGLFAGIATDLRWIAAFRGAGPQPKAHQVGVHGLPTS